jgi:vitamin B12 transporter
MASMPSAPRLGCNANVGFWRRAFVAVEWNPIDQLLLSATWLRVSSWIDGNRDLSIPRLTAPGYTVVNLAANYTINPSTTVFARIDNLLNEQYQNPTGFDRSGFGIFGGVRVANR